MKYKEIALNGKYMTKNECRGVQRYTREIYHAIDEIVGPHSIKVIIPRCTKEIDKFENIDIVKFGGFFSSKFWQYIGFQTYILMHRALAVNLGNDEPLFSIGIAAVHDVRFMFDHEQISGMSKLIRHYFMKIVYKNSIKNSQRLITVSCFSKKEILRLFPKTNMNKVYVCYNAWQHMKRIEPDEDIFLKHPRIIRSEYYFLLGGDELSKNMFWVKKMVEKYNDRLFVMAGPPNTIFPSEHIDFTQYSNFIHLGYIPDSVMKALMRWCKAFLFPSKYEGFGIPPLEAISAGGKSIISNSTCLPEIYKNYVSFFDPEDYDADLDELMEQYPSNSDEVLNIYSWEKTGRQVYRIISELIEQHE